MQRLPRYISVFLGLALALVPAATAQPTSAPEYEVKAAFVLHFLQFIEWPGGDSERTICSLNETLYNSLKGLSEHSAKVSVMLLNAGRLDAAALKHCSIVYIGQNEADAVPGLISELKESKSAIVTDDDDRGDINLIITGGKVRFRISPDRLKNNGVRISSRLLNLAVH
jgi:hypothetical protein